jgi:hypothetical protein
MVSEKHPVSRRRKGGGDDKDEEGSEQRDEVSGIGWPCASSGVTWIGINKGWGATGAIGDGSEKGISFDELSDV